MEKEMKLDICSQHVCQPQEHMLCLFAPCLNLLSEGLAGRSAPERLFWWRALSKFLIPISILLVASSEPVVLTSNSGGPQRYLKAATSARTGQGIRVPVCVSVHACL